MEIDWDTEQRIKEIAKDEFDESEFIRHWSWLFEECDKILQKEAEKRADSLFCDSVEFDYEINVEKNYTSFGTFNLSYKCVAVDVSGPRYKAKREEMIITLEPREALKIIVRETIKTQIGETQK